MNRSLSTCLLVVGVSLATVATSTARADDGALPRDLLADAGPSLHLSDAQIDAILAQGQERALDYDGLDGDGNAPRRWWPIALSALVPGLGETVAGYRRGWVMMAADAGLWYGVWDRHDEGEEWEDRFEAFADENWSQAEWERQLAQGDLAEYFPELVAGSEPSDVPLYVSKEEDRREWYENLGKWDQFAWGWREYWEDDYDPGDPANPAFGTPLRAEYVSMRGKSNDAFAARDNFFNVAVLFRVFSIVQMAYLEGFVGGRYEAASPRAGDPPRVSFLLEPASASETRVGWKVSY